MKTSSPSTDLGFTERLDTLLYQFITLYERWAEDRQVATHQLSQWASVLQTLTETVKRFEASEPHVRKELV